jgi:hypothetical protein
MAWPSPGSAIFTQAALNPLLQACWTTSLPTGYGSLSADTINAALYGNSGTPDKDAAVGSTGYNTGAWVTGNEISGTGYTAGGAALASKTFASATGAVNFGAANTSWTSATITNAFGDLVYDNTISGGTVAKQGLAMHYFGGAASVTSGTFTVAWNSGFPFQFTFAYA